MSIVYQWHGAITNHEVNALPAEAFRTRVFDESQWNWIGLARPHGLGRVVARVGDDLARLANVLWDGIGTELVARAGLLALD